MKIKIQIDLEENSSRVFYSNGIYFTHHGINYLIRIENVRQAARKYLDNKALIERLANQAGMDPEDLMATMSRPKVTKEEEGL